MSGSLRFTSYRFHLERVLGFNISLQIGQACRPEAAVLLEPRVDGSQGFGIDLVDAVASLAMLVHEMRPAQQAQVLRDGWTRNWKSPGNLSRRLATPPQ
jgi:hypothetical protein